MSEQGAHSKIGGELAIAGEKRNFRRKEGGKHEREESLNHVTSKRDESGLFTENSACVRCSRIAAAVLTNIDSIELPNDEA